MATIKDVAKLAGVSHGTVSNVLNGSTGVSLEKIKKVEEAVRELGYRPNAQAKSLKSNKATRIYVIFPCIHDIAYASLYTNIEQVFSKSDYFVSLHLTNEICQRETALLNDAIMNNCAGVILITCQPNNKELFRSLADKGLKIVFLQRKITELEHDFVGFDYAPGIAHSMTDYIQAGYARFAMIAGPKEYSAENCCIMSFINTLYSHNMPVDFQYIESTQFNKEGAFKALIRLLECEQRPEVIYVSNMLMMEGALKALEVAEISRTEKPRLVVLSAKRWQDTERAEYDSVLLPYGALAENAADLLLQRIENGKDLAAQSISISEYTLKKGQASSGRIAKANTGKRLKVLLHNAPSAHAVQILRNDFYNKTGIKLSIDMVELADVYKRMKNNLNDRKYDVVSFDIPWIQEIDHMNLLTPLDAYIAEEHIDLEKYFPDMVSDQFCRYNGKIYALPYVFTTQILFYRKDLFSDLKTRRLFYKFYKRELGPPETWEEYNQVSRFFTRQYNPDSPSLYGAAQAGMDSSGAFCEFVVRLWSLGGNIVEGDRVVINSKEALEALCNYVESFQYATPSSPGNWWKEQSEEFMSGDCAMMMSYTTHSDQLSDSKVSAVAGNVEAANIPCKVSMLGGWSIGIFESSGLKDEAFEFVKWLTSPDMAIPNTVLGGFIPTNTLYDSLELTTMYPWLRRSFEVFEDAIPRKLPLAANGKCVSERLVEDVVGHAVHEAITGRITPEEALEDAEKKLCEIFGFGHP